MSPQELEAKMLPSRPITGSQAWPPISRGTPPLMRRKAGGISGTVTALDQSITATDDTGANPENLTGLIGIAAMRMIGPRFMPTYYKKVYDGLTG